MVPKEPKPRFVALALGGKLGRLVTLEEIGFGRTESATDHEVIEQGAAYQTDTDMAVGLLHRLTNADLNDKPHVLETARPGVSQAPPIITGYLFSDSPLFVPEPREPVALGAIAESVRETTADLMAMDFKRGGGHTRRLLLHYFRDEVVPLLRQRYPTAIRREVFGAAGEVAQLLGWSAYDAGRHGAATRYFVQSLRLAREAEDFMMGGRILSNLSHQANFLGRYDDAVKYARAAQNVGAGRASNTVMSMFVAMEARALASQGDRQGSARAFHQAEQLHERRKADSDPHWISYFNEEELASEGAHCFRDLGMGKECREFAGRSMDPLNTPPRTLAFMRMVSAAGTLAHGDVDHAAALATEAVSLGVTIRSARYMRYLTDFRDSLSRSGPGSHFAGFSALLAQHYPDLPRA